MSEGQSHHAGVEIMILKSPVTVIHLHRIVDGDKSMRVPYTNTHISVIVPIFRKGNINDVENYKSITLLSTLGNK